MRLPSKHLGVVNLQKIREPQAKERGLTVTRLCNVQTSPEETYASSLQLQSLGDRRTPIGQTVAAPKSG